MGSDYRQRAWIFVILLVMVISILGISKLNVAFTKGNELEKAPQFVLNDINGKKVKLSSYRGKIVILDFFATWCPPCVKEIPHFVNLQKKYGKKGFIMLGISLDSKNTKKLKKFIKEKKINYPILWANKKVKKDFGGIRAIPTTFVIDQKGMIYKKYVGYRSEKTFIKDIMALKKKNKS